MNTFSGAARRLVEVDRRIELKEAENVCLGGVDRLWTEDECVDRRRLFLVDTLRNVSYLEIGNKPLEINRTVLGASHQSVSTHVVEPIGVELAQHNRTVHGAWSGTPDQIGDIICKAAAHRAKGLTYLAVSDQQITHMLVVRQAEPQPASNLLERMTEGAMPEIMHQRCRESDMGL